MKKALVGMMTLTLVVAAVGWTNTDSRLNGTWEATETLEWGQTIGQRFVFDAGNFILEIDEGTNRFVPTIRGTFTTSGNTITMRFTHMHREAAELSTGPVWLDRSAVAAIMAERGELNAAQIAVTLDNIFTQQTSQFLLIGNRLSLTTTITLSASERARIADAFDMSPSDIPGSETTEQEFIRRN